MKFREQTLDNGLEVIAECNDNAYSTALAFFVKTGSRDETDEISGVSHFLEHMVFKGTPRRSAADVNRELDEIGSHSNAFTSEEQTVYYAAVLPEFQDRAVELLSDIMRPSLREEDFETEKKVILEEIAKYDDQPPFGAHEKCMELHFSGHPLGRIILGTPKSVTALTPEQMRSYFQKRYSPKNITLAASGKVDFDQLVAMAEQHCGHWEPFDAPRDFPRAKPQSHFQLIHKQAAFQQYITQIADGSAAEDDDRYACRTLATIFGDDSGSRMFWDLVDTGRAEYAVVGSYEFQGTGILMTFLCCAPEAAAENLQRLHELQTELQRSGVTEAELKQAKNKICSHVVLQSERPVNRLFSLGNYWIQRHEYFTVRQAIDAYQAVTVENVNAVLKRYPLTTNSTVALGPLKELAQPK